MFNQFYGMGMGSPSWFGTFGPLLGLLLVWSIFWKGLALWHAGRRGEPWWFVILLVVNTFGILEIIYLFAVAKLKFSELFSK
jgi:methionyl-tRNA synthetase